MSKIVAVTNYQLSGEGIGIGCEIDPSGEPELLYDNGEEELRFTGREVALENTQLGLIVSATLETVPDLKTVTLSVMLPTANRPDNMRSISIETFALITTNNTTIAGPDLTTGQIQHYEFLPLNGNGM